MSKDAVNIFTSMEKNDKLKIEFFLTLSQNMDDLLFH
jgi:hypothetical protein